MVMSRVEEFRISQRAKGPATIMAIGTAVPVNCVDQISFPDYYFGITNSDHMIELKEKFKRICEKSMIKKRHLHLTEEMLRENQSLCEFSSPSFDARQDILVVEVPKLGCEAALKAITEWGQPLSMISHVIFATTSGIDMPGADYQLCKLLGLHESVKRLMMYQHGCYAGAAALRMAKDISENNVGARVLVVCSEMTVITFRGPNEAEIGNLVGQPLLADGAAAVIVGSDPIVGEPSLFQLVCASQMTIPNTLDDIVGPLREAGLLFSLSKDVPQKISDKVEQVLKQALYPLGISDWNSIFWVAHPGGRAILDQIEEKLSLEPEKLGSARHVLSEYGNMSSATVLFVLDEMRKSSKKKGLESTGEGLDWGVLFGFGPGITIDMMVLHSIPIPTQQ